jgi:hypothetical protein
MLMDHSDAQPESRAIGYERPAPGSAKVRRAHSQASVLVTTVRPLPPVERKRDEAPTETTTRHLGAPLIPTTCRQVRMLSG